LEDNTGKKRKLYDMVVLVAAFVQLLTVSLLLPDAAYRLQT